MTATKRIQYHALAEPVFVPPAPAVGWIMMAYYPDMYRDVVKVATMGPIPDAAPQTIVDPFTADYSGDFG